MKEEDVEQASLTELARIEEEAGYYDISVTVIGGYAVRSYTPRTMRYTKDIDLVVNPEDLPQLKAVLKRLGYDISDRPHGLTTFRRAGRTPISVNVGEEAVDSQHRTIDPYYDFDPIEVQVATIEDLLVLKAEAGRERDLIDICTLFLDSFDQIDMLTLRRKADDRGIRATLLEHVKFLLDASGSTNFRKTWQDFMGRQIEREEETMLWQRLTTVKDAFEN